jgi:hypothetical protein
MREFEGDFRSTSQHENAKTSTSLPAYATRIIGERFFLSGLNACDLGELLDRLRAGTSLE